MGGGNHGGKKSRNGCATDAATAYKQALKLCGDGMYMKALTLFDRAIAFRMDCSHYFAARANCKQAIGRHVDAYHDYVSAIRLNHTKCSYFSCRGLCLLKMGKLDAALSDFSKACELEPTAAVYHYQKASLLHHRLARQGEAVVSYGECLANVGPGDTAMTLRCLHAKGICLFEEGRATEAVADLSRAVEMSDASPASLHYLAKALKAVGRETRALAVLGEAIEKWEHMPPAANCGGATSLESSRHEVFFDRGVIRLHRGDDAGALLDFDRAVDLSAGARGEYFVQRARARARVAMRSNGREEAVAGLKDIEKAMKLKSDNPEFLFTAGVLCSRMGEYERALGHLRRLLEQFDKPAVTSRGETEGETKDAVTSPSACEFETALCLFKLGRPLQALSLAESALKTSCSLDAQRFQLRGLILHDLRRFGDAVKDFTASIAVNGQRPEGYLLRGRSLAGLSSHERAIDDFTRGLAVLRSKQNGLGGAENRENSSSAGRHGEGGACKTNEDVASDGDDNNHDRHNNNSIDNSNNNNNGNDNNNNNDSNNNNPHGTPDESGSRGTNIPPSDDRAQRPPHPAELSQDEPHADGGRSKISREDPSRRGSQSADGGDGMGEGGSVAGAFHYARALSLQQLGRYADAAVDFDAAIAEGPVSWQRLWHRATCQVELGDAFRRSVERDLRDCLPMAQEEDPPPEMRNFLFQVGLAYYRLGDIATALECFERAEEEKLRRQSDEDSTTATVNRRLTAASSSPEGFDDSSLHYHRGLCLVQANELDEAEDSFSLAIECRQQAADGVESRAEDATRTGMRAACHSERGKVRQLLRDFDGARADFTVCLERFELQMPTNSGKSLAGGTAGCTGPGSSHVARTLFRRGWANKALGCLEEAAADFEAARRLEPLHPHLSVDYRNIFDTELVVIDDIEPLTQAPALFHSW